MGGSGVYMYNVILIPRIDKENTAPHKMGEPEFRKFNEALKACLGLIPDMKWENQIIYELAQLTNNVYITLYEDGPILRYGVLEHDKDTDQITFSKKLLFWGSLNDISDNSEEMSRYKKFFARLDCVDIIPGVQGVNPFGEQKTAWYRGTNVSVYLFILYMTHPFICLFYTLVHWLTFICIFY